MTQRFLGMGPQMVHCNLREKEAHKASPASTHWRQLPHYSIGRWSPGTVQQSHWAEKTKTRVWSYESKWNPWGWLQGERSHIVRTPKVYVDVYSFSRAAVAKYHKLGGLNNRSIFCHSSGGWKSQIKVSAGLVCFESWERESVPCLFPGIWWFAVNLWHSFACRCITLISPFIFTWLSLCVYVFGSNFPFL